MTSYRLYSVDGEGKIVGAEWLDASNDIEAVDLARALKKGGNCEVWSRTRFVQLVEAFRETVSASRNFSVS